MSEFAMASTNGVASPTSQLDAAHPSLSLSMKRKREGSKDSNEAAVHLNGSVDTKQQPSPPESPAPQHQILDFIEILRTHDTSPSILKRPLSTREPSSEPAAKRKKSDPDSETSNILSRASSGSYASLDDIVSDIKIASTAMVEELQLPNAASRNQYTPIPTQAIEFASQVTVFKNMAEELVNRERAEKARRSTAGSEKGLEDTVPLTNGASKTFTQLTTDPSDNKLVLTLYGNAGPGAKQLFSSLQDTVKTSDGNGRITKPLREAGLPNGINTTRIVPIQSTGLVEDKKRVQTIGELFATSSTGLPFQPPKPSKIATTRGSTVGWYQPAAVEAARSRSNQSYFDQNITSGQWLDYSGISNSSDVKRKQRDRALSLSGAKVPSPTDSGEQEAAKLEALFRTAYSSFAPSRDDAAAIVPGGLLDRYWWQQKNFARVLNNNTTYGSAIKTDDSSEVSRGPETPSSETEFEQFKEMVENWDKDAIDPSLTDDYSNPQSIEEKDVEDVLQDISELLETLNSYQRNRNLSLNPVPRPGTDSASTLSKPSEGELATYNMLKAQLALMISTLPPYAVAKLDSDQLSELNISTRIEILTDSYKGVMEEDEYAARAKVAAMTSAASSRQTPVSSLHRSSSSSLYGNQYATSSRPAAPGGQQYYSQTQTPVRAPSANMQRPPQTAPAPYGAQRPPSNPNYRAQQTFNAPTYPHQIPRPSQQYGSGSSQQYFQTPTSQNYGSHSQNYGGVPQSAPQASLTTRYQQSSQQPYQQRPAPSQNGIDYRYSNGNSAGGQPSPQKSHAYSPQPSPAPLGRSFNPPAQTITQDRRYFQPPTTNGSSSISPQPQTSQHSQTSGGLGATGYHTVMTQAEQNNMMERQRAQLAQQQGTQHQARNAAQAGAIGSPTQQVNGGNPLSASP